MTRATLLLVACAACSASTYYTMESGPAMGPAIQKDLRGENPLDAMLVVGGEFFRFNGAFRDSRITAVMRAAAEVEPTPMKTGSRDVRIGVGPPAPDVTKVVWPRRTLALRWAAKTIRIQELRPGDYEIWRGDKIYRAYRAYAITGAAAVKDAWDALEEAARRQAKENDGRLDLDPFALDIGGSTATYDWLRTG